MRLTWLGLLLLGTTGCAGDGGDGTTGDDTDHVHTDDGHTDENTVDGATVYADNCAVCHGTDGEGLSGPAMADVAGLHDEASLADVISNGSGNMPAVSLFDSERDAVVDYVIATWGS